MLPRTNFYENFGKLNFLRRMKSRFLSQKKKLIKSSQNIFDKYEKETLSSKQQETADYPVQITLENSNPPRYVQQIF